MANEKNLKKGKATQFHSGEEAARNGKKGGKASGRKKREQKAYKEIAKAVLSAKIEDEELLAMAAQFGVKKLDVKTLTFLGMVKAAADGSHNAFDRLLELTGEKEQDENADVMSKLDKVIGEVDKLAE